jgi:hypothetical protein
VVRVRTVHCPLCGLRYQHVTELDAHARDAHVAPLFTEGQEVVRVRHGHHVERPLDQVLRR